MLRIAALNESSSSSNDSENETFSTPRVKVTTKEAQESQALSLYSQALSLHRHGDHKQAEDAFREILQLPWLQEVPMPDEGEELVHPALILKYSIHKNLASMASKRGHFEAAMESYLEAVALDSSDVMIWSKMGIAALKLENLKLAAFAFEQGLQCNPHHWPCLDNLCTLLYAINNYERCLYYISQALERDAGYVKGLVLRQAIMKEQPSLERYTEHYFKFCDPEIYTAEIDEEESKDIIDTALKLRVRRQELRKPDPKPVVPFPTPLECYSWKCLGENLVSVYDYINTQEPPVTLSCKVDVNSLTQKPKVETEPTEAPMSVDIEPEKIFSDSRSNSNLPSGSVPSEESSDVKDSAIVSPPGATAKSDIPVEEQQIISNETSPPKSSAPLVTPDITTTDMDDLSREPSIAKKSHKRKRGAADDEPIGKRRSARVRNTRKKEEEEVINYHDILIRFLPSSLLTVKETEEESAEVEMKSADSDKEPATTETPDMTEIPSLADEEENVKSFIEAHQRNSGVLHLMRDFCKVLSQKSDQLWPLGLSDVFVKVYDKLREHINYPDYCCRDLSDEIINQYAKVCLLWTEFKLDHWLTSKPRSAGPSPLKSPLKTLTVLGPDCPGKYYEQDLFYMVGLTGFTDILKEFSSEYTVRVLWLKARFLMLLCKMEEAVDCFEMVKDLLTSDTKLVVNLVNCRMDNTITKDVFTIVDDIQCVASTTPSNSISQQLESLQRCQSLEEVQKLHDKAEYKGVIKLLLQTLSQPQGKGKHVEGSLSLPERNTQLLLLLDALHNIKDYQQAISWGETALNEIVQKYYRSTLMAEKEELVVTLSQVLTQLDKSMSLDKSCIKSLPSRSLVRLSTNLLKLIETSLEASEHVTDMPLGTVLPWILLYRLIEHEEMKMRSISLSQVEFESCIPSSLMLLKVAHEYLGRRSWCTNSDGALLRFFIDIITEELHKDDQSNAFREELDNAIEQCFYCLYGHPNRKTKARHLHDHNTNQVDLTWERAIPLFEYFKPKAIPEYDSYKSNTVSSELENLLQRISKVVPPCEKPENTTESVSSYVDGETNTPPKYYNQKDMPVVREIYYLLADYYFKNKETKKAIDFYVQDLCCNPDRFDSWAGMALARSSKVETKLNSCETQREGPSFKQTVVGSLRCFKRALEIDDSSGKLWIEYGALAYLLHSHASRQLKQSTQGAECESLQKSKAHCMEMLKLASDCYTKASLCDDEDLEEEWLHHYMLGKVAEKMKKPPGVYLEHYSKASQCLHEDHARYPKKITYIVQPPHLAIESLEMHYRLHVSALKYLLNHKDSTEKILIKKYLMESANSPYARAEEKKKERRYSSAEGMKDDSISNLLAIKMDETPKQKSPTFHATPQDHDYSRLKMGGSPNKGNDTTTGAFKPVVTSSSHDTLTISDIVEQVLKSVVSSVASEGGVTTYSTQSSSASVFTVTNSESVASSMADVEKSDSQVLQSGGESGNKMSIVETPVGDESAIGGDQDGNGEKQIPMKETDLTLDTFLENEQGDGIEKTDFIPDGYSTGSDEIDLIEEDTKHSSGSFSKTLTNPDTSMETSGSEVFDQSLDVTLVTPQTSVKDSNSVKEKELSHPIVSEESMPSKMAETEYTSPGESHDKPQPETSQESECNDKYQILDEVTGAMITSENIQQQSDSDGDQLATNRPNISKDDEKQGVYVLASVGNSGSKGEERSPVGSGESKGDEKRELDVSAALGESGSQEDEHSKSSLVDQGQPKMEVDSKSGDEVPIIPLDEVDKQKEVVGGQQEVGILPGNGDFKPEREVPPQLIDVQPTSKMDEMLDEVKENEEGLKSELSKEGEPSSSAPEDLSETDGVPTPSDVHERKTQDNAPSLKESKDLPMETDEPEAQGTISKKYEAAAVLEESASKDSAFSENEDNYTERVAEESKEGTPSFEKDGRDAEKVTIETKSQNDALSAKEFNEAEKDTEESMSKVDALPRKEDIDDEKGMEESKSKESLAKDGASLAKNDKEADNRTQETVSKIDTLSDKNESNDAVKGVEESPSTDSAPSKKESKDGDKEMEGLKDDSQSDKKSGSGVEKNTQECESNVDSLPDKKDSNEPSSTGSALSKGDGKDAEEEVSKDDEVSKFRELIDISVKGLHLTLSRYPHHYKALYRLAHLYTTSPDYKDLEKAKNLLLGPRDDPWLKYSYMPCPALFTERKTHNFFNGVWKMPVEDVERPGSFATHLYRTTLLLISILRELKDGSLLNYLYTFLNKKPDSGRKFLRDSDRILLAKKAFESCVKAYLASIPGMFDQIPDEDMKIRKLLEMYRLYHHGVKENVQEDALSRLLEESYKACRKDQLEDEPSVFEQARRYCQQHIVKKQPLTPSQADGTRSTPSTPNSVMSPSVFGTPSKGEASLFSTQLPTSPQAGSRATKTLAGPLSIKSCSVKLKPIGTKSPLLHDKKNQPPNTKELQSKSIVETKTSSAMRSILPPKVPGQNLLVSSSFMQDSLVSKLISGMSASQLLSSLSSCASGSKTDDSAKKPGESILPQASTSCTEPIGQKILESEVTSATSPQTKMKMKAFIPLQAVAAKGAKLTSGSPKRSSPSPAHGVPIVKVPKLQTNQKLGSTVPVSLLGSKPSNPLSTHGLSKSGNASSMLKQPSKTMPTVQKATTSAQKVTTSAMSSVRLGHQKPPTISGPNVITMEPTVRMAVPKFHVTSGQKVTLTSPSGAKTTVSKLPANISNVITTPLPSVRVNVPKLKLTTVQKAPTGVRITVPKQHTAKVPKVITAPPGVRNTVPKQHAKVPKVITAPPGVRTVVQKQQTTYVPKVITAQTGVRSTVPKQQAVVASRIVPTAPSGVGVRFPKPQTASVSKPFTIPQSSVLKIAPDSSSEGSKKEDDIEIIVLSSSDDD